MTFALSELAARVGGEVSGDGDARIERVASLEDAGPGEISFFSNRKYRAAFDASRATAVVVGAGEEVPPGRTVLRARDAYLAFAKIATLFHPPMEAVPVVAEQAVVDASARVDPSAQVMAFAFVGAGAVIGARCILFPGTYVGPGATLGDDCVLWPGAVVRDRCVLRNRVVLEPGAVVGSDGFGFAFDPEGEDGSGPRHYKVPQTGTVVIEDDVEIGANTCVDRATLGATVIGRGAKIDNLVQVAHNVEVGPLSLLVSQVGIAGSTKIGAGVVAAGQVGIAGHLAIGDGARIAAQSGIMADVEPGAVVMGYPAVGKRDFFRLQSALRRMPELAQRVAALEKRLQELQEKASTTEGGDR